MNQTTSFDSPSPSMVAIGRRRVLQGLSYTGLGWLGTAFVDTLPAAANLTRMNITTGELKNWRTLKGVEGLEEGLEFLEKTDLAALPLGKKHEIDGGSVFATASKSMSRALETAQFESHRKYIDIQYLIAGAELIGVAPVGGLNVVSEYSEAKDVALYSLPPRFENIEMHPGQFVVFFPEDGHLPLCHLQGQHEIHKIVVKVSVEHWKARKKSS